MKKLLFLLFFLFLLSGCSFVDQPEITPHEISPGSVIEPGGYISFANMKILYNGETFSVTNNGEDIVRVSVMVVGLKTDGSYDPIQWPVFTGTDETQYQKDLKENGWAVKLPTNMVRPGETLDATLDIFSLGEDYPAPDIDGDGYYDIVFCVHPQKSEDNIQASTDDPVSAVYKLKAN